MQIKFDNGIRYVMLSDTTFVRYYMAYDKSLRLLKEIDTLKIELQVTDSIYAKMITNKDRQIFLLENKVAQSNITISNINEIMKRKDAIYKDTYTLAKKKSWVSRNMKFILFASMTLNVALILK